MTETSEMKPLTDKEIIEKLLNGASLRTFMIPDESIPSNFPEHIETYDLPHIIINGDYFWGKSDTAHLGYTKDRLNMMIVAFCYTNIGGIFGNYNPNKGSVRFMNKRRYKIHRWYLKENYRLIWDSEESKSTEEVMKAIELSSKFKIAMLDLEDVWNIHPVDLPMFYTSKKKFELKTVFDNYPMFFRYPSEVKKLLHQFSELFESNTPDKLQECININCKGFCSFYSVSPNGDYYNYFDISRKTTQRYKRLKVFVDNH